MTDDEINERFDKLEKKIDNITITLSAILTKVDLVVAEVKPTIDELMKSPLLKMVTGGRK